MSDIPSVKQKIQIEGAQFRSAVSESLVQAIGGSINAILDETFSTNSSSYTTAGSYSFIVPAGVNLIYLFGAGGGGGGAGGGGTDASSIHGGGGGGGGSAGFFELYPYVVSPSTTLNITIGAAGTGGAAGNNAVGGNGSAGGSTIVSVSGTTKFTWPGGRGGNGGNRFQNGSMTFDGAGGLAGSFKWAGISGPANSATDLLGPAGDGGAGGLATSQAGGGTPGASGGGNGGGGAIQGGGGGAGGGTEFSAGGAGGKGAGSTTGVAGSSGSNGSGGGGGGGARGDVNLAFAGGNGSSGFLYVLWNVFG